MDPRPKTTASAAPSKSSSVGGTDPDFPPVGDIQMSKAKGTYNTYKLELSYGQIMAIRQALEAKHDDPIADELLAMFDYYMRELPGPGEDEEAAKKQSEDAKAAEDDFPIPMPPEDEGDGVEGASGDEGDGAEGEGGEVPTEDLPELGDADASAGEDSVEAALSAVDEEDRLNADQDSALPPEPPAE